MAFPGFGLSEVGPGGKSILATAEWVCPQGSGAWRGPRGPNSDKTDKLSPLMKLLFWTRNGQVDDE